MRKSAAKKAQIRKAVFLNFSNAYRSKAALCKQALKFFGVRGKNRLRKLRQQCRKLRVVQDIRIQYERACAYLLICKKTKRPRLYFRRAAEPRTEQQHRKAFRQL